MCGLLGILLGWVCFRALFYLLLIILYIRNDSHWFIQKNIQDRGVCQVVVVFLRSQMLNSSYSHSVFETWCSAVWWFCEDFPSTARRMLVFAIQSSSHGNGEDDEGGCICGYGCIQILAFLVQMNAWCCLAFFQCGSGLMPMKED